MCKVSAVTKVTDQNRDEVWIFMQLLGELMSQGNYDGLGYASFDKSGNIFGEKWLFNKTAFKDLTGMSGMNSAKMDKIYAFFGDKVSRDESNSIILHTRAATCAKSIQNTHPFVDNESNPQVAIIHNGMIYNDSLFTKKYSTCDSEVIAHLYAKHGVSNNLNKLNDFASTMEGWWTVLALAKDSTGRMIMDAFSENGRLGSYYIEEFGTRIYSTQADDVYRVAKSLGLTAVDLERMQPDTAFRLDVLTGEVVAEARLISSNRVPIRVTGRDTYWDNVTVMNGNLSDEEFKNAWFAGGFRGPYRD
jgi:Glutamine amidotransferase domain